MATLGNFQPTISTASTTTDATGNVLSSAVYVFNAPCDLSQLRDVNLAGATLHFTSAVDVQKLKDLNLKNAKLIFNNSEPCCTYALAKHADVNSSSEQNNPPTTAQEPACGTQESEGCQKSEKWFFRCQSPISITNKLYGYRVSTVLSQRRGFASCYAKQVRKYRQCHPS